MLLFLLFFYFFFFIYLLLCFFFFFFFNDTATTEIYTLSLHDALPIRPPPAGKPCGPPRWLPQMSDRKSTRLNSSHSQISYAVFCLKKKKKKKETYIYKTKIPINKELTKIITH